MKPTTQSANGTSYHSVTIDASINQLSAVMGEPEKGGIEDKVTHEWTMETDNGDVFTVYDWKEYRELNPDEIISFHIGGHNTYATMQAKEEIKKALNLVTK